MLQGSERIDFAALHAPIAPFTWALTVELPGLTRATADVPIRFTRPVEILGIKASVLTKLPVAGGGRVAPTLEDIDVLMQTDNQEQWTKTLKESGSAGGYVPLSALTVDVPRLLRIVPGGDGPDFTFQFQWAQFRAAPAVPFYEDAIIRLSLLARYLSKEQRNEWLLQGCNPPPGG